MYRMYLIHRKIWEFITLVPSLYVQTVQVQKQKKTDYQTKNYQKYFYSENIGNQRKKTRKENFHIDSISSLSLSLSRFPLVQNRVSSEP